MQLSLSDVFAAKTAVIDHQFMKTCVNQFPNIYVPTCSSEGLLQRGLHKDERSPAQTPQVSLADLLRSRHQPTRQYQQDDTRDGQILQHDQHPSPVHVMAHHTNAVQQEERSVVTTPSTEGATLPHKNINPRCKAINRITQESDAEWELQAPRLFARLPEETIPSKNPIGSGQRDSVNEVRVAIVLCMRVLM